MKRLNFKSCMLNAKFHSFFLFETWLLSARGFYFLFLSGVALDLIFSFYFLAGPGSFLVRPSDNSPGDYSLFFHINNQIQRFRIEKKGVRYLMGGRTFECLDAVINRYRKEQIVEGHTLVLPVSRVSLKFSSVVDHLF